MRYNNSTLGTLPFFQPPDWSESEQATLVSGLQANSYYAAKIRELGEAFDLDDLSSLADEIEKGEGTTAEN